LNLLFDKWHLGPLRLIDFFALVVLTMRFAPQLRRLPRLRALETMGAQSLPVFCTHLVLALVLLAWSGDSRETRPWATDGAILAACFAILHAVASTSAWLDRRTAALRERESERWRERGRRLSEAGRRARERARLRSGRAAGASRPAAPPPRSAPSARSGARR
jgi:peptidoglycan/LPS O-acetylase OafA/YrhL